MSRRSPSPRRRRSPSPPRQGSRIFVANLPLDVTENELEDLFYKFGRIEDIELRRDRTNDSTIAFVQFADYKAADEAIEGRDGTRLGFHRIRIERSRQRLRRPGEFGRSDRSGYGREGGGSGPAYGPPRRSEFRVRVYGLPPTASWQDLKDHMRRAGDVGYANIDGGVGVVEYSNGSDMDYALRKLHGSVFRNIFHTAKIRVERDSAGDYSSPERRGEDAERERRRRRGEGHEDDEGHGRRSRSKSPGARRRRKSGEGSDREREEKRRRDDAGCSDEERARSPDGDRIPREERAKDREGEDGRRQRSVSRSCSRDSRRASLPRDAYGKEDEEEHEERKGDGRRDGRGRSSSRSPSEARSRGQKREREDEREDDRRRGRGEDEEETHRNGRDREERFEEREARRDRDGDDREDKDGRRRSFEDRESTRRGRREDDARYSVDRGDRDRDEA
ncbi:cDNA FLJ53078, highly similar to Splicing factor,arginine/serine-rich 1, related [Neospora caninum Liverpool]|uniref:cDNA FLJ53078, highly similar to Splicing factor,arginine/serine-rich 1, related n=1 Tax=Neospora caninum (strain Liverpool) TaxID=572307 RepID=F0VAA5_NEOCL|nr:cDNA FLJ53078, highly similar to Splicing factor,arginine/serine-rich 1, related [Neospora caninum Liverpool]CBZ50594.1 cDNA FLJ53078, highly similar to Splicing factor,arginine/serine-rich 1, related [Neospora caninum Liverpool]|eukprot:XP_003880627.1 cDNA FLJ53078, highly similar to Splicing factor,arginine/serine-rich 1, related [Neospora caninum Liverpool]